MAAGRQRPIACPVDQDACYRLSGGPGRLSGGPGRLSGGPGRLSGGPGRLSGGPGRSADIAATVMVCTPLIASAQMKSIY